MAAMQRRRFLNPAQPQTLLIAVYLLYFRAAFLLFALLVAGTFPPLFLALVAGGIAAGYGIANEFKWGYILGIVMAIAPFVFRFIDSGNPLAAPSLLNLMFEIALVALLLHPLSRDYQRLWFK
jgi:hypothetical protein